MFKKVLICVSCVALLFSAFTFSGSALWIDTSDAPNIGSDNLLLIPRRTTIFKGESADNTYEGITFASNPLYAPEWVESANYYTYLNQYPVASFVGASYMSHYTQRINCYYSGEEYYRYIGELTRALDSQQTHEYIGQFDFESFYIRNGIDANSWIIYKRNNDDTPPSGESRFSFRAVIMCFNEDDGWYEKTISKSFSLVNTDRVTIRDLYDWFVSEGAYTEYDNGVLVRSLSLQNRTYNGSIFIYQDRESVGDTIKQHLVFPLLSNPSDDFPPLVNWLSNSLGNFFDTTVFAFGGFRITLGTIFIVPLAMWLVVAFLKKFAGG